MKEEDFSILIKYIYDFIKLYDITFYDERYLYLVSTIGIIEHMRFKQLEFDKDIYGEEK